MDSLVPSLGISFKDFLLKEALKWLSWPLLSLLVESKVSISSPGLFPVGDRLGVGSTLVRTFSPSAFFKAGKPPSDTFISDGIDFNDSPDDLDSELQDLICIVVFEIPGECVYTDVPGFVRGLGI